MRNTWAAYLVNIDTGKIEWTLGGKHSSFEFGPGAAFQWQHDVKLQSATRRSPCSTITAASSPAAAPPSRRRDRRAGSCSSSTSARTRRRSWPSTTAAASSNPNTWATPQPLQGGNTFVGWGSEPYFSEYSPSGKLLLEASFPGSDLSYRATVEPWVGLPLTAPAGAARQADGRTTVYASWNGATQVVSWRVLAGSRPAPARLAVVTSTAKSGFETAIRSAAELCELRGAGAGRRRTGDRNLAAIHAEWSMTIQASFTRGGTHARRRDGSGTE